jgi:hypothetical protein
MLFASIMPTFAKNLNLPNGADRVYYGNAGGTVDIAITPNSASTPLPTGYPPSVTAMRFKFMHNEMPNAGESFDVLTVFFWMSTRNADGSTNPPSWQPFMVVTDNPAFAQFSELFFRGSLVKWNVPPNYPLQPAFSTNNVQLVDDDDLSIVRHGNSVTIKLTAEQTLERPIPVTPLTNPPVQATFKFPAFTLELNKAGEGSTHSVDSDTLNDYPDASGYTYVFEMMGFDATAVFNAQPLSTGQPLRTGATSNGGVAMKLTHTYFPAAG